MHLKDSILLELASDPSEWSTYPKEVHHLESCQDCKLRLEKIVKMQSSLDSKLLARDDFSFLQDKIKASEKPLFSAAELKITPTRFFTWQFGITAIALTLLLIGGSFFYILGKNQPISIVKANNQKEIFVIKKTGDFDNLTDLHNLTETKNNLSLNHHVQTKDASLQLRIGEDKVIELYSQSHLYLKENNSIELQQGSLIFELLKNKSKPQLFAFANKPFLIVVDELQIYVLGTRFKISKKKDKVLINVEHGHLRIVYDNLVKDLYDNEQLIYSKGILTIGEDAKRYNTFSWNEPINEITGENPAKLESSSNIKKTARPPIKTYQSTPVKHFSLNKKYKLPKVPKNSPLSEGETVYYADANKFLAINISNGTSTWEIPFSAELPSQPLLTKNHILVPTKKEGIYVIDKNNGEITQKIPSGVLGGASIMIYRESVIMADTLGQVSRRSISTSTLEWSIQLKDEFYTTPILYKKNQLILVGYKGDIYTLDLSTGHSKPLLQIKGTFISIFSEARPSLDGDVLYISGANENVYAIDLQNKKVLWQYVNKNNIISNPVLHRENVLIASTDKYLHVIDKYTGKLVKKVETKGKLIRTPIVDDDKIFIAYDKGIVVLNGNYSIDISIDHQVTHFSYQNHILSVVDATGKVKNYLVE